MSERERFEAWMSDDGKWPRAIERDSKGEYLLAKAASDWTVWQAALARSGQAASGSSQGARSDDRTGWPPGLLQDDSRELSRALASKPDAMVHARDAVAKIGQPEAPTAAPLTDEEIEKIAYESVPPYGAVPNRKRDCLLFARALLAAAHTPARSVADPTTAAPLERGTPCEVQDGDPDSPTHRQWFPARLVALDLIGGEPIVQRDKRMPTFATWGSVRGIKKPTRDLAYVAGAAYERDAAGHWSAHPPARSGADFSTSDPCPSCRGVGSIGEPPIQCPFCRLHKLGQEAARSGAGSDDRKDESWK